MSPATIEAIGSVAAVLTTLCWVPQALTTLRTRETRAISLWTQSLLTLGVTLWLAYGLLLGSWPLIAANATTLLLVAAILVLKLRHG